MARPRCANQRARLGAASTGHANIGCTMDDDQIMSSSHPRTGHICAFESRRAADMRSLIEKFGLHSTIAPSMQEIPLDDNPAVFDCLRQLQAGEIDVLVFMTGVGAEAMRQAACQRMPERDFFTLLASVTRVARGPKPTRVLRDWKLPPDIRAPEPNTWRELFEELTARMSLRNRTVAVQEYGEPSTEFYEALTSAGARVVSVPVYRWALPEDLGPLQNAIRQTLAGQFDVLLFTSAKQVEHVLAVAEQLGLRDAWREAARAAQIGSIGPTCSARLESVGLPPDFEAAPPKMGSLVKTAAEVLAANRRG